MTRSPIELFWTAKKKLLRTGKSCCTLGKVLRAQSCSKKGPARLVASSGTPDICYRPHRRCLWRKNCADFDFDNKIVLSVENGTFWVDKLYPLLEKCTVCVSKNCQMEKNTKIKYGWCQLVNLILQCDDVHCGDIIIKTLSGSW